MAVTAEEFKLERMRLQNERLKIRVEGRRARRVEMLPGSIALSLIGIMGFSIVMLFVFPMPMTEAAGTLAVALVTAVTTNVGVIVGFFYGSSKTSKEKDATASSQAETIGRMAAAAGASLPSPAVPEDYRGYMLTTRADGSVAADRGGASIAVYPDMAAARSGVDRLAPVP